jgi:hypothetical protein
MIFIIGISALGALGSGLKYLEQDAIRQLQTNNGRLQTAEDHSLLNAINPFLPASLPAPTPQLSKEYLYAGYGAWSRGNITEEMVQEYLEHHPVSEWTKLFLSWSADTLVRQPLK